MKHLYDPVQLDAGAHFCIVCGATNQELMPECPQLQLSQRQKRVIAYDNEDKYGQGKWVIRDRKPDMTVITLVSIGDTLAP